MSARRVSGTRIVGIELAGPTTGDAKPPPSASARGGDEPAWTDLSLSPNALSRLLLALPFTTGANLVVLDPTPDAAFVIAKRAARTVAALRTDPETGVAVAILLARASGVDPLSLPIEGACRRLRVRLPDVRGELLVCLSESPAGLAVELRPLSIDGQPPGERPLLARCVDCDALQRADNDRCELDGGRLVDVVEHAQPGGFVGPYRLGEEIGRGGMGVVLAGEHVFLRRPIAMKLVQRSLRDDPLSGRRFLSEARAASRLDHPGIVRILDYGLLHDGRPYMVMERLHGESLQDRLDHEHALDVTCALSITRAIAEALDAAHAAGVVHLDLKPSNVILIDVGGTGASRVKLIDFGAAALAGAAAADGEGLVGTPHYMSPEHACGEVVDRRSDIYALGVMLFEMLSGRVPFEQGDALHVLKAHMVDPPPPLESPRGPLPQSLVRLVGRMLRKRPAERHQSAAELITELDQVQAASKRKEWLRWLP